MTDAPKRVAIATYGTPRQRDYVRVFVDAVGEGTIVRAQFRHPRTGKLKTEPFGPDTKAARAAARKFGEGMAVTLRRGVDGLPSRLTVADVGKRYLAATLPNVRQNTRENYTAQWRAFVDFVGPATKAEAIGLTHLDDVRVHYRAQGLEHSTVREIIATAKRVWKWAEGRELIARNRLYAYRYTVPKDERKESPDEYSVEEFTRILAAFHPAWRSHWRAWVALTICGAQGARQHAVLHLRWADIDPDAGVVIWRAAWDKNGEEWTQPLRTATRAALDLAAAQAERAGLDSEWVLPAARTDNRAETYSPQSLWSALRAAEDRAGVAHQARRAGHGARRMVAGEVLELTGDPMLALQAIGDRDLKMATRYLKKRDRRIRDAFTRLDVPTAAPPNDSRNVQRFRNATPNGESRP